MYLVLLAQFVSFLHTVATKGKIIMCPLDRHDDDVKYFIGLQKVAPIANAADYWLDGSNSMYRAYKDGEPDNDVSCFIIVADDDLEMADMECDVDEKFICKIVNGKIIYLLIS